MQRTITIFDSATNRRITLNGDYTTFGEVKAAAIQAGINVTGKDWLEGLTKTQPAGDDSILPTNIPHKDQVTNDLVYMLTNTNKQIKSGADRKALYEKIAALGLKDFIKRKYNRNFTQVSSSDLEAVVAEAEAKNTPKSESTPCHTGKDICVCSVLANMLATLPSDIYADVVNKANALVIERASNTPKSLDYSGDALIAEVFGR